MPTPKQLASRAKWKRQVRPAGPSKQYSTPESFWLGRRREGFTAAASAHFEACPPPPSITLTARRAVE